MQNMGDTRIKCSLKQAGIIGLVLTVIFLISFGVTLGILYMVRISDSNEPQMRTIVGSLKVDAVQGRNLNYDKDFVLERHSVLKSSLEMMLTECLGPLPIAALQVTSLEEDHLSKIFGVNHRGAIVRWRALLSQDVQLLEAADELLRKCQRDIVFDPESVKVGMTSRQSGKSEETFETFLLNTDEEFDLRYIELSAISAPAFKSSNATCPPLQIPDFGSVEPVQCTVADYISIGLSCKFSCDVNYNVFGEDTISCLATGAWDNLSPKCSRYCYRLPKVDNGAVYPNFCTTLDLIPPGTQCTYYCNSNYALEGGLLTCSAGGSWDGVSPVCKKTCPTANSPKNGIVFPTSCRERRQKVGQICSFDCNKGYTLSGPPSTVCDISGRWGSLRPSCRKACPLLRMPSHGTVNPNSCVVGFQDNEEVMEGIMCVYTCEEGYHRVGPEVLLCGEGGVWLGREAECKKTCPKLDLPANVQVSPKSCVQPNVTEGTRCDFECVEDAIMFGVDTSTVCLETGFWSTVNMSCHYACPSLPVYYDRVVLPLSCLDEYVIDGTECHATCNDQYHLQGDDRISCLGDGQWSGSFGLCLRKCDKLPPILHGYILPSACATDGVMSGSFCEFFCDGGHALHGLRVMTCLEDGSWAGTAPICKPDGHFMIQQYLPARNICLSVDFATLAVVKSNISTCQMSSGPQWWTHTMSGHLKNMVLDMCLQSAPLLGSEIDLVECDDDAMQLWEIEDFGNSTTISILDEELFLSSGSPFESSINLTNTTTETEMWDLVYSNITQFDEKLGVSCPKLKNSSVIVRPHECVLSRFIETGLLCNFSCLPGYILHGDDQRECVNGSWTNAYPMCRRGCPGLNDPIGGNVTSSCNGGLLDQNTRCTYTCGGTHVLVGEEEVTCLPHGEWSDPEPMCIETCPEIESAEHGTLVPKSCGTSYAREGDECAVDCNQPFISKGNTSIVCQSDGAWSGNLSCLRVCTSNVLPNVIVECTTPTIHEGTECTYRCGATELFIHELPAHNKDIARICTGTGLFNTTTPRCGRVCPSLINPLRGNIEPSSCLIYDMPEGQVCSVKCMYGYEFRGVDADLLCTTGGTWNHNDFRCVERTHFSLYNDDATPEICARTEVSATGPHFMKEDKSYYKCNSLVPGSTWMWVGDMFKNVLAELCVAVQDLESSSFSLVVLRECDETDPAQQWDCEYEFLLRVISAPFYLNAGTEDNSFLIARRYDRAVMSGFLWKSTEGKTGDPVGGACFLKFKRCPPLTAVAHGNVDPPSCLNENQPAGSLCEISCDAGFRLNKLMLDAVTLNCTSFGAWRAEDTLPLGALPAECRRTCPALSDPAKGVVEPAVPCKNDTSVYGQACHYDCDYLHKLKGADVTVCMENGAWSHPPAYCSTTCRHGAFSSHSSRPNMVYPDITGCADSPGRAFSVDEGVTCYYRCNTGLHRQAGSHSRTCRADGSFSGSSPFCYFPNSRSYYDSRCILTAPNGTITYKYLTMRTKRPCVEVICPAGYLPSDPYYTCCDSQSYTWTPTPTCLKKCEDISVNCQDMHVGQICYMECRFGKTYSQGNGIYLCQPDGQWNDTVATCVDVKHFHMQTSVESSSLPFCLLPIIKTGPYFNAELMIESCRGEIRSVWAWKYTDLVVNLASGLCLTASGAAHGARLYLIDCNMTDPHQQWECSVNPDKPLHFFLKGIPAVILGSSRALLDHTKQSYHAVMVDPVMLDEGNLASTGWKYDDFYKSDLYTLCALKGDARTCPPLKVVATEDVSFSPSVCLEEWAEQGQVCSWFCAVGEPVSYPTTISCDNGIWSSTVFICRQFCPALDPLVNGTITNCNSAGGRVEEGSTCKLECDPGTYPITETARICQWDGSWSGEDFQCATVCEALELPPNALITPLNCLVQQQRMLYGKECEYSCIEGYYLSAKERIRSCLANGSWSGVEPTCVRVCPSLEFVAHATVSPSSCLAPPIYAGGRCTITCDTGHLVQGNSTRVCSAEGTWVPEMRDRNVCQRQCERFPTPEDSVVVCKYEGRQLDIALSHYSPATECRVLCDLEYVIEGPGSRTCHDNGTWSGEDAYCYPAAQFLVFLSKRITDGLEETACLSGSDNFVRTVSLSDCDAENPEYRWSWHAASLLKNSGTGLCISVAYPYPGQRLTMAACNETDKLQQFSCDSATGEWFLRMRRYELFPDFGFASSQAIWTYDLSQFDEEEDSVSWYAIPSDEYSSDNAKVTVCSTRGEESGGICSPLSDPSNGKVFPEMCTGEGSDISAGLSCSFQCNVGYKLESESNVLVCQKNGLWSASPLNCEAYCYPLTIVPNMLIHPESCIAPSSELTSAEDIGILPGGECVVSCDDGYVLEDNVTSVVLTCLHTGQWSSAFRTCNRICPSIAQTVHMTTTPESCSLTEQSQGTMCTLSCDPGYGMDISDICYNIAVSDMSNVTTSLNCTAEDAEVGLVQDLAKLCLGDGTWSGSPVKCVPVCLPIVPPRNGRVVPPACTENLVREGGVCSFVCDEGFVTSEIALRSCDAGRWVIDYSLLEESHEGVEYEKVVADFPVCVRYCEFETYNDTATHRTPAICNREKIPLGTVCTTSCSSDYILVGESKTSCYVDGSWDETPGKCIKKCNALSTIENGELFPYACTSSSLGYGAVCVFTCLNQYVMIGSAITTCNSTGQWSSPPPKCERKCNPLPKLYNGMAYPASCYGDYIVTDHVCQFACDERFKLEGASEVTCMENGEWDAPIPRCISYCTPFTVQNATVNCSHDRYIWGTVCHVQCDRGLAPSYLAQVSCDGLGDWTPEIPRCVETGVPMYIMQSLDSESICLRETEEGDVVRAAKADCLSASADTIKSFQWRWLENFNIQNIASGRCLAAHYIRDDEPVMTSSCNIDDVLQLWECSTQNPFRLLLKDTEFSPSTYMKGSKKVVLQRWSDAHSYFTTLSLNTATFSSLCSRRPGGACPPLRDIPGGSVGPADECQIDTVQEGVRCLYQCTDGNSLLVGDPVTQCLGNGLWMFPPPKCVGVCPLLTESLPAHAYYADPDCVFDEPQHGQVCTAGCLTGYEIAGNASRTCLETGAWSERLFECKKICAMIFGILDGGIDPTPCRSGSCSFSCDPGYVLDGRATINCQDDGEWDWQKPRCIRDTQFQIISLLEPNGTICLSATVRGNVKRGPCAVKDPAQYFNWHDNSQQLVHTKSGLCLAGSATRWGKITLETCDATNNTQLWNCGTSQRVNSDALRIKVAGTDYFLDIGAASDDLDLVMETSYYSTSRWYAENYFVKGTACLMRTYPQCSPFVPPLYGRVVTTPCQSAQSLTAGVTCKVECNSGYQIASVEEATCLGNGKWSASPSCKGTTKCMGLPIPPETGRVIPSDCVTRGMYSGQSCTYRCDQGYLLVGEATVTCLDDGTWSSDTPFECVQICPPVLAPDDGTVSPRWCQGYHVPLGTECRFSCDDDYKLLGVSARTCKGYGSWTGDNPQCASFCPKLQAAVNGKVHPQKCTEEEHREGYVCQFSCHVGYALVGSDVLSCADGSWSHDMPTCIMLDACPVPLSYDCDMMVEYEGLYLSSHIVPGTNVSVSCGTHCSLSGPKTRMCMEIGQWEQGTPYCRKKCPLANVAFGVLVSPASCNYDWQSAGSFCYGSCIDTLTGPGKQAIQCQEDGLWSKKLKECHVSGIDNSVAKTFMIRQYFSPEQHHCLQADDEMRVVIRVDSAECSESNSDQLWRWYSGSGYRHIQSVSSELCWWPRFDENGVFLALSECIDGDTDEAFSCGNIESQEDVLRISTGNLFLVSFESSPLVQFTSSLSEGNSQWESYIVDGNSDDPFRTNNSMSLANTLCRAVCGGEFTSNHGFFTSPRYPSNYIRNVVCDWKISTPNRKVILWLHDVSIHQSEQSSDGNCIGDHLLILDGDDISQDGSNVLGQICGNHRENVGPFVGTHGIVLIRFMSDDAVTSTGFTATWDSEPLPPSISDCGLQQVWRKASRIVGGSDVDLGEVPWFASLMSLHRIAYVCGATIVSSRYVLTAADCFVPMDNEGVASYGVGLDAGHLRLLLNLIPELVNSDELSVTSDDGATLSQVIDVLFDADSPETSHVALVKVGVEIPVGDSVSCLPPPYLESVTHHMGRVEKVRDYCILAGWNSDKKGGERELHVIDLPVISDRVCDDVSLNLFGLTINTTSTVCAAHFDGSRVSVCEGDQGSGMVCRYNRNYYVIGVALNFQLSRCRELNIPKYFARTSIHRDWISRAIDGI